MTTSPKGGSSKSTASRSSASKTSENKTKPENTDVAAFIAAVPSDLRREDALTLVRIMREITGEEPVMWGPSIVGFGSYHYRYASGREGDAPAAGFSPRKPASTVYITPGYEGLEEDLAKLGPHTVGKSCLYLKSLADVDLDVLRHMIKVVYDDAMEIDRQSRLGS